MSSSLTTTAADPEAHLAGKVVRERHTLNVPLNRVEGDLAIRVQIEDGVVVDAWSCGTMFRGIENILIGRGALDGLVITPRVCGICSTAHLVAAARALNAISRVEPPPDAVRIQNVALAVEMVQSDVRQTMLMYLPDFANPAYESRPFHETAVHRYAPMKGSSAIESIRWSKRLLEIVAILGGQWPHSSYMVPGGVVTVPSAADLLQCRSLLAGFRRWYERQVLGCPLERWHQVRSRADLDSWLEERPAHRESDLGFFLQVARVLGLEQLGRGHANLLCVGGFPLPPDCAVPCPRPGGAELMPPGFYRRLEQAPFDQTRVEEHVKHSWYVDYPGGRHPSAGETRPYASGDEGGKYSWAKAPRYDGQPAETGPLAELLSMRDPLTLELVAEPGVTAFTRQLARLTRPAVLLPVLETWLAEIPPDATCYVPGARLETGVGIGLTEATRGALGHWVEIAHGRIVSYQIVTPTAWNGSPRDASDVRGPWEEALVGTPVGNPANPVELGHVVRSFDPCLVCTVHALGKGRGAGPWTL